MFTRSKDNNLKRKPEDNGLTPSTSISKRKPEKDSIPPSPPGASKTMTLASGQLYHFNCPSLGMFRIRGGSTGNCTIDGQRVTIRDTSNGHPLFSEGTPGDQVTVTDNIANKTTIVSLIPGGNPAKVVSETKSSKTVMNKNGTTTVTKTSKTTYRTNSSKDTNQPLQIVAQPNEYTVINGSRSAVVTGNGGYLDVTSSENVQFHGSLQTVNHSGSGNLTVYGDVRGKLEQSGIGALTVEGNVSGNIVHSGGGTVNILGKHLEGIVDKRGVLGTITIDGKIVSGNTGSSRGKGAPFP